MRRRIALLLGALLAASALAIAAPTPAAATDVCAGQGTATTGPLFYPVTVTGTEVTVQQAQTVGFGFTFMGGAVGTCVSSDGTLNKQLTAGGTLTGWCGHSSGQGVANDGHNFAWISVGSLLVITGHLVGVVNAVPNALAGQSCLTGATQFLVTGAAALIHCTVLSSTLVNVPVPETLTSPVPGVRVHTGDMNYHASVCVPGAL